MAGAPLVYRWDGEAMAPLPRFAKECDRRFVIGQTYMLDEIEERSQVSHSHEFAWLREAWLQLPESIADQFPSPESLRKRALIDGGFYNEMVIDAGSNAAALRVAQALRAIDEFAVVVVRGGMIVRRTAKSQSRRAMDKREFQASKTALMDVVAQMIGVSPDALASNAGRAA